MDTATDSRGQSMQLGAVLLFGFFIVALTTAQATLVPNEIAASELDHSQQVTDQLVGLSTAVYDTSVSGTPQPATVTLGPDYDPPPPFVSPPPGSGTLRTTTPQTVTIANAASVTTTGSFDNYWTGATRTYETRAISYRPTYRELDAEPATRIEYGMLTTNYSEGDHVEIAGGRDPLVDGTEITLPLLTGELHATSRRAESVVVERVTDATTVTVEGDGDPIRLEIPTTLSASTWREQIVGDEPTVTSVTRSGDAVTVTLAESKHYDLTIHRIVAGSGSAAATPTYLRNATEPGWPYSVDVRDQYNDRIEQPARVWAYNESNFATPEARFEIPSDPPPGLAGDVCYTLQRGVTTADRPVTVGVPSGSCQ